MPKVVYGSPLLLTDDENSNKGERFDNKQASSVDSAQKHKVKMPNYPKSSLSHPKTEI